MKVDSGAVESELKHTVDKVFTAVSGLQCIGDLLESLPNEGGVSEFSEIQLTGLGNIIVALTQSIGSDMDYIEGAIKAAREGNDHGQ